MEDEITDRYSVAVPSWYGEPKLDKMGAGLGLDYDDGYMKKRWFISRYRSPGPRRTSWFRVFGIGIWRSSGAGFKILLGEHSLRLYLGRRSKASMFSIREGYARRIEWT